VRQFRLEWLRLNLAFIYIMAGVADRVADAVDRVSNAAFHFAPTFLGVAPGIFGFAFGFELTVTGQFTGLILDPAFRLVQFAFRFVAIWY
jgi:hypothetical protein